MAIKCLIVDDVGVSRFVARTMLEELGCQVIEAESSEACLEAAEKEPFDFILLDWHLRRESGIDLIQQIRKTRGNQATAIIVCSGIEHVDAGKNAFAAGANGFIPKPLTRPAIEAELRKWKPEE